MKSSTVRAGLEEHDSERRQSQRQRKRPAMMLDRLCLHPAQIALLSNVPFAAVDGVALTNGLAFTDELQDVPFGPNDTAIIHTADGNYFKVGLALCYWESAGCSTRGWCPCMS